ncbi:MAG: YezD family protein, partial [Verrucomicrobiota bacterium]
MSTNLQNEPNNLSWLQIIQKQVSSIRFGVVQLTVHNGEVVQIERTEKTRIDNSRLF